MYIWGLAWFGRPWRLVVFGHLNHYALYRVVIRQAESLYYVVQTTRPVRGETSTSNGLLAQRRLTRPDRMAADRAGERTPGWGLCFDGVA
jgi:hypothetical protein